MHIDLHHVQGEMTSYSQKRIENDDGETSRLQVDLGLLVQVAPRFLDQYLEGHNSGAQPSMVFWRTAPNDGEGRAFPRYMGLGRLELRCADGALYTLKLLEVREDTPDALLLPPAIEVLVDEVIVKKCEATIGANGAAVKLKLRCFPRIEYVRLLGELQKHESVDVSLHNTNGDLFMSEPEAPPRLVVEAPESVTADDLE